MDTKIFTNNTHAAWKGWLERVLDYERERMYGWSEEQIIALLHKNASRGVSLQEVREFYWAYPYPVNEPVGIYVPPKPMPNVWNQDSHSLKQRQTNKKYYRMNREKMGGSSESVLE
jgi:hypothetical protein